MISVNRNMYVPAPQNNTTATTIRTIAADLDGGLAASAFTFPFPLVLALVFAPGLTGRPGTGPVRLPGRACGFEAPFVELAPVCEARFMPQVSRSLTPAAGTPSCS